MTTKLKVDATRLLGSLKYAFAGSTAFIGELLQNARRAGADKVSIEIALYTSEGEKVKLGKDDVARQLDPSTSWYPMTGHAGVHVSHMDIQVDDNGRGIEDMQDLLHIAHSGWDDSVQQLEKPYGLGFMSAVLAAKKVKVHSNGVEMSLDTDLMLQDGESGIAINSGCQLPEGGGTSVRLAGVAMPPKTTVKEFFVTLARTVRGFPLPVSMRDFGPLPQPHAIMPGAKYWEEDSLVIMPVKMVGVHLYLQGLPIGTTSSVYPRLELQTYLPIRHSTSILSDEGKCEGIAVHLDSSYRGRMPDRAYLYDEADAVSRIDKELRNWQFSVLSKYLARITGEVLESFTAASISVLKPPQIRQLFLYSNILPGVYPISKLDPGMNPSWSHHFTGLDPVTVTRDSIAAGEVFNLTVDSNLTPELLPRLLLRYKYFTAPSFEQAFPELAQSCDSSASAGLPDMSGVDGMRLCKKVKSKEFDLENLSDKMTVQVGIYPSDINTGPLFGTIFVKDPGKSWVRDDSDTLVAFPSEMKLLDKRSRAVIAGAVARNISRSTKTDAALTMFLLEALGDDLDYIRGELTKVLNNHEDLRAIMAGRKLTLEMGADGNIKSIK